MLRRIIVISLVLAVAALAAVFASLNPAVIPLDLAFGEIQAPLTLVLIFCLALGWVLGLVSASFIIFRMMAQRRTLRRSLGLVDVPVDAEVYMLYSSYLGRAGAHAYFEDAPAIALGVTGGGVNAGNPDAVRTFLSWERLCEDLRAASAHTPHVYVFSLEGCVERRMLEPISSIDWDDPPPPVERKDRSAAWRSRWMTQCVLRMEPLFDALMPSTRRP